MLPRHRIPPDAGWPRPLCGVPRGASELQQKDGSGRFNGDAGSVGGDCPYTTAPWRIKSCSHLYQNTLAPRYARRRDHHHERTTTTSTPVSHAAHPLVAGLILAYRLLFRQGEPCDHASCAPQNSPRQGPRQGETREQGGQGGSIKTQSEGHATHPAARPFRPLILRIFHNDGI